MGWIISTCVLSGLLAVFIAFLSFAYRKINRLEKRLYETTKARDKADKKLVSNHKSWEKYANGLKEAGIRCEDEANEIIAEKNRIIREKNIRIAETIGIGIRMRAERDEIIEGKNRIIDQLKAKLERSNQIRLSNMNAPQPAMEQPNVEYS